MTEHDPHLSQLAQLWRQRGLTVTEHPRHVLAAHGSSHAVAWLVGSTMHLSIATAAPAGAAWTPDLADVADLTAAILGADDR